MDHYSKARREGLRVFSAAGQNNQPAYLPVLEEKVSNLAQLSRLSLGVQTIPLDRVVGSVSQGRSYAFASNFQPILEPGSEFASKWERLYASVEEQGVNQPITVLEYLGWYYVIEGNKRASVMKSMEAEDIEADVTRVIPEKTGEPENIAYFEYCDFAKESGLYNILFTRPGSYEKLLSLPGVRQGDTWQQDEILTLRKLYSYFHSAYLRVIREKGSQLVGDAFLTYLEAFGYAAVKDEDLAKTEERIRLMSREFESGDRVKLVMDPTEAKPAATVPILGALFRPSKIKAAFLYTRSPEESAWNYWHNLGRLEVEEKLGDKVETVSAIIPSRSDFTQEINQLIQNGYTAIFATSPVMLNSCIEPALNHPDVRFLCCSLLSRYTNIRTYYMRFYEAKFLLGLAAGILSRSGKIGYIADYPIFGVPSAANAFAIGVRMVNPTAKVYLNWTSAGYFNAENPFEDPEIQVICNRDITAPTHNARDYGLYIRNQGEIINMATMILRWGPFYRIMIERQLSGNLPVLENRDAATNYWWGLNSDILDVAFSARFDPYVMRLINHFRQELKQNSFSPFEGELRDQAGRLRCEADRRMTPAEILRMDYLADNIVGNLPTADELIPSARPLVKLQGINGGGLTPEMTSFSWNRK